MRSLNVFITLFFMISCYLSLGSNLKVRQEKEWSGVKYIEDGKAKTRTIKSLPKGQESVFNKIGFTVNKVFNYGPAGSKCQRDFECELIHHPCKNGKCT